MHVCFFHDEADFSLRIVSLCSLEINGFRVTFDVCSFSLSRGWERWVRRLFEEVEKRLQGGMPWMMLELLVFQGQDKMQV